MLDQSIVYEITGLVDEREAIDIVCLDAGEVFYFSPVMKVVKELENEICEEQVGELCYFSLE